MSSTTTTQPPSPSPTKPLASRDVNTFNSPANPNPTEKEEAKSMDYHRQVLQNRLASEKGGENVYVSPSDTILSPCTKKLNGLKMGRFGRAKPQSLFAKMDKDRKADAIESEEGDGKEGMA